jgi:hypothetical protein
MGPADVTETATRWDFASRPVVDKSKMFPNGIPVPLMLGFLWDSSPGSFYGIIPIWFLITLSAALAVAPWMRWRFNLRTLLIATTLIAFVLGAVV